MHRRLVVLTLAVLMVIVGAMGISTGKDVELTWYFCCSQQTRAEMFGRWAREFEKLNPNVKVNAVYPTGSGSYYEKVMIAMVGGSGPDVVWLGTGFWRLVDGFLAPLDNLAEQEADLRSIYAPLKKAHSWKGRLLGIPYGINTNAVYYNKDMLDAAGMSIPSSWTWDDLIRIAKRLTNDIDADGTPDIWGFSFKQADINWHYGYGGHPYNAEGTKCIINNLPNVAGVQVMADIWTGRTGTTSPYGRSYDARKSWVSSNTAMILDGVFNIQEFQKTAQLEWDVAPMPGLKFGDSVLRSDPMTAEAWAVWSGTPHPKEAMDLLRFISNRDHTAEFAAFGGVVPSLPKAIPAFLAPGVPQQRREFVNSLDYVGSYLYQHPVQAEISAASSTIEAEIWRGEITPQSALERLESAVNRILAEYASRR